MSEYSTRSPGDGGLRMNLFVESQTPLPSPVWATPGLQSYGGMWLRKAPHYSDGAPVLSGQMHEVNGELVVRRGA